jgi:hypothetical protein
VAEPRRDPWWRVQRAACLVLGSAIVIDALAADKPLAELIIGCVVLGVLPVSDLAEVVGHVWPRRPEHKRDEGATSAK